MNSAFILLLMIFCHIIDDYYLQGWLASAKQQKWWQENAAAALYRFDYLWALIMHAFSWAFMIMLPIAFNMNFEINTLFVICFIINVLIHAVIDNEKANKLTINLWLDQLIHLCQLIITFIIFI